MSKGRLRTWWSERQAERSSSGLAPAQEAQGPMDAGPAQSDTPTLDVYEAAKRKADEAAKGQKQWGVCEVREEQDPVYGTVVWNPTEHAGATPDVAAQREEHDADRAPETGRLTKNPKGQTIYDPTKMPVDRDPEQWAVDQYRDCLLLVAFYERDEAFGPMYDTLRTLARDTCRTPEDDARFPGLKKAVIKQGADSCKRIDAALKTLDKRHAPHQFEVKDDRDTIVAVRDQIAHSAAGVAEWELTPSLLPPEPKAKAPKKHKGSAAATPP